MVRNRDVRTCRQKMVDVGLDAFWRDLSSLCGQLERHFATDNIYLAERLAGQCDTALDLLRLIYSRVDEHIQSSGLDLFQHSRPSFVGVMLDLVIVIRFMQEQFVHYSEVASTLESTVIVTLGNAAGPPLNALLRRTGQRGRPPFVIPIEQLEALIELGFNMTTIATLLGVSERTIRRRREIYGLPIGSDRYSDLSDVELGPAGVQYPGGHMATCIMYIRVCNVTRPGGPVVALVCPAKCVG